jgi:hypothetical protein
MLKRPLEPSFTGQFVTYFQALGENGGRVRGQACAQGIYRIRRIDAGVDRDAVEPRDPAQRAM